MRCWKACMSELWFLNYGSNIIECVGVIDSGVACCLHMYARSVLALGQVPIWLCAANKKA